MTEQTTMTSGKDPVKDWTGERVLWQKPEEHIKEFRQCMNYYFEAMEYAKDKTVIDAACGSGFGTFLLSLVAIRAEGIDIANYSDEWMSLQKAVPDYRRLNFRFSNLEKLPMDTVCDLVVSIETIEHLGNPEYFLGSLKSKELFFTIPCYGNKNEFHKVEYSEESAKTLITQFFPNLTYHMEKGHMIGYATR